MIKTFKRIINEKRLNIQSLFRKIRLRLFMDSQQFSHLKATYHCPKKWYGSSYGGFYVNPDLLDEQSVVYSFGIGKDISFDKKMMKHHKCTVYGFDPTPKSIDYINTVGTNNLFHFFDYGISTKTCTEKFFLPVNEKGISGSMTPNQFVNQERYIEVKMKHIDDIAEELGHKHIDVVKMDIEGSEYEVLETMLDADVTITQLLVEFHDRFFDGEMKSKRITELIKNRGFEIFAASMNFEEISFINTKLAVSR